MAELLTLARPYAKAAFSYAQENNCLEQWSEMLADLAVIASCQDVIALRDNPAITAEDSVALHLDVANIQESHCHNFLRLLAENKRLNLLPEICVLYEQHKAEATKRLDVELISAVVLDESQRSSFAEKLKQKFGREIKLSCREDATLIGGAIVRAGDKVIDGSLKGRLHQMAESFKSAV